MGTEIITGWPDDKAALETLYAEAFPDEDLWPLVTDLVVGGKEVLSLYAMTDGVLSGHVVFTRCQMGDRPAALLGPLCVTPALQRSGIGSQLVESGLHRLTDEGVAMALVLGDPDYYSRFGFEPRSAVPPPCPIPSEWAPAWQDMVLIEGDIIDPGPLTLPDYWMKPELWSG